MLLKAKKGRRECVRLHSVSPIPTDPTSGRSPPHHVPVEGALSGRLASPADVPQAPVMAAPAQFAAGPDRLAFGAGGGAANEPVTMPPETAMVEGAPKVPITENGGGCFQILGAPGGADHFSLNFEARTGTRGPPLKMVVQLLAPPGAGTTNFSFPLIVPSSTEPALVPQGAAVLPSVALTVKTSEVAVPPVFKGGLNLITPVQLLVHVTEPGRMTGFARAA